jgi:hypothetical protein
MPGSSFELSMMMLTHRSSDPSQGPSLEEAVNSWSTIQKQGFVVRYTPCRRFVTNANA